MALHPLGHVTATQGDQMQPLWIPASRDDEEFSPRVICAYALLAILVNVIFVGLILFCS